MQSEEMNIYISYSEYNKIFNSKTKQVVINVNLESVSFPETLIDMFINNANYFSALKEALMRRQNLNIILTQNDVVLLKNAYTPLSIVLAIKHKEDELQDEFKREFMVLLNKIKISNYLSKNSRKTYSIMIENEDCEFSYSDILNVILDQDKYYEFINSKSKYFGLTKNEFVYLLKRFILEKRLFYVFELTKEQISLYKSLIDAFDTYAINEYLSSNFKYSSSIKLNKDFEFLILNQVPENTSILEKTIYIYLSMFRYLKYDFELDDTGIIKRHKDLSRIEEINAKNNRVFSYEFTCLLAKFFEKLGLTFEYSDKYIIARINKYIIKYKAIASKFNIDEVPELNLIKGITILNDNRNSRNEFSKVIDSIYRKLYQEKINLDIINMPFSRLLNCYKMNTSKISIPFELKEEIFKKLIKRVALKENAIGYIYELKTLIFNQDELDSNISFATIAEIEDGKTSPAVIITINHTNINLYNSNEYIYYNPPNKIEFYNLNKLRMQFFKGRFKYIKNSRDNIIGLEKSSL